MYIDESVSHNSNEYQALGGTPMKRNPSGESQRTNSLNSDRIAGFVKLKLAARTNKMSSVSGNSTEKLSEPSNC